MNTPRYALFCLDRTHMDGCENLARKLVDGMGFVILSVGDTGEDLTQKGIMNTPASLFVRSFCPKAETLMSGVHLRLLADEKILKDYGESELLSFESVIEVVYVTLNETELRNERNRAGRTLDSCRQLIDVQGPALLHSAVHGGKIAVSSSQWEDMALEALSGDSGAHSRLNHCAMTAVSGYYQEVDRVYLTFFKNKDGS